MYKFVVGAKFFLEESLDIIPMWIRVIISSFLVVILNSNLVIDSTETPLHLITKIFEITIRKKLEISQQIIRESI
jgi:hypothetical protein